MVHMLWIDTTDLKWWASTRDCRGHLPLLMYNLIMATTSDISHIIFPAGNSIGSPGWDGILETSESNEYVPKGISVWEMGCNQKIKNKADADYEKRKKDTLGLDPLETTYIFVTPRKWNKKDEWRNEKKKECFWKDIKVYDTDDLEGWIKQAPAVGLWLGQNLLGKYPKGIKSLVDWQNEWNNSTIPPLTSKLVLAGRENDAKSVNGFLTSSSSQITVQASTIDESIAFLAAVIDSMPEKERKFYLSRSIVVSNSEAFQHISTTGKELLLIPKFVEIEGISVSLQKGHRVYIPVGPDNNTANPETILTRLGKDAFISAIEEMGLSKEDAQNYSRDTGRSLTVLRRKLTDNANQPEWAKADSARDIIPAMLCGRWNETSSADKEIIRQIVGESYESFSQKLYSWQNQPDSPILKIGSLWRLVSPMDAFFALAPFITPEDLQHFKKIVHKVLRSLDPALDLEPKERWMAAIYGKTPLYSQELRKGILQTLILIAVFGDNAKIHLPIKAQNWVDNIINELLNNANCELWTSISDDLRLIAESSPISFMHAIESSFSKDDKPIMCLFNEVPGMLWPSSNHSDLLWALEQLAWSPDLLSRVTLILGELTNYDPGGKLANRPNASLREIFLLWHPQTYATMEKRFEVLDLLIEKYPEVGWNLLIDLMPKNHDIGHPNSKPIWRQFSEKVDIQITKNEHITSVKELINRLLSYVGNDGQRWIEILDNYPSLPSNERNRIIKKLSSCKNDISNGHVELWSKLREIISMHRSYPDSDWALPEKELQALEEIYISLEPTDTIDRIIWLFDEYRPNLLQGIRRDNYHTEQKLFIQYRSDAINAIRKEYGFEGLIDLAKHTKNPEILGEVFVEENINSKEEEILYSLLEKEDKSLMIFVQTYIFRKAFDNEKWIKNLVEKAKLENWPDSKVVNLFVGFPSRMVVWNLLSSFNENIQESYWKKCGFGGITRESEDIIYYLKQMLKVKKYFTALDIAALYSEEIPPKLIAEILEKAAKEKSEDNIKIQPWDVEKLFEEIYKSKCPKNEIAKLEWIYLPFLARVGSKMSPKMLHNELSNDPEFFATVMRYAHEKIENEDKEELPSELSKQRARNSLELIHSWKIIPGSKNGQIDYKKLKSWIVNARESCKKYDLLDLCDIRIGNVLANAKSEDDIWPPEAICKIIDEIQSENLHNGFEIGVHNNRGVVVRSLDEGGKQEIILAKKFRNYADNLNTRYPKTASILYRIADDYENQAKRENDEAEIRDLDF